MMNSREIREAFLRHFEERGHRRVASSSLIPAQDPTLLFTNAGMNQFKDVFTGREARDYRRAATAQKCVRAGGKHNDLDNVGYTGRHQTFFEMLGNFSFGDYFKDEAIRFAWDLVTDRDKGYGLDPARLWATVYTDDDEAAGLWERFLPPARILRFGDKDNFWAMGETGPCGPCSEIHYYQGADLAGNRPELVNGPGDETVEIWNLVFMQFERDAHGRTAPLPKPSVDTGAGLERISAILQGVNNNFDTDLFRPIVARIEEVSGKRYRGGMALEDAPFRVIADHARAATMLMADGVIASNEGRGYVLRRIIRRALRYARQLRIEDPILYRLAGDVLGTFQGVYFDPAAAAAAARRVERDLRAEEERFVRTLSAGIDRIGEELERLRRSGGTRVPGDALFRLYDTHGIPVEVIEEIARDEGLAVDRDGFEKSMDRQRERSRTSAKFEAADSSVFERLPLPERHSEFRGYPELDFVRLSGARVVGIVRSGAPANELAAGETGDVIADRTVFYPEGGGQVADTGTWSWPGGSAEVTDTQKPVAGLIAHRVAVREGALHVGAVVDMEVPEWTRRRTQANHTGTHLLHAALHRVVGDSARQMGSLVAPDRLRFDYASSSPLTEAQIAEIERLVNEEILRDVAVAKEHMSMEESKTRGAIAFFGEKYGERVRVVTVGGFSTELCGGCHVPRTGEIGSFKILSHKGLASGVRRIEAVTALGTVERLREDEGVLGALSATAQSPREGLLTRWQEREEKLKALEHELAQLKLKMASGDSGSAGDTLDIDGIRLITRIAPGLSIPQLRNLSDALRSRLKSGVVVVATAAEGKTSVVAAVTADLVARVPASKIAARVGKALGGSGGGRPDLAQAGGKNESLLAAALKEAEAEVRALVSGN